KLRIRGESLAAARDNVIFELGMFMGALGRERCFMVFPVDARVAFRTATDFLGMSVATYSATRADSARDPRALMSSAAASIRTEVNRIGRRRASAPVSRGRFRGTLLQRGDTSALDSVADGALDVADHRYRYHSEIRRHVMNGEVVPSKYQYWTPDGSRMWLDLCQRPTYRYHVQALRLLRQSAPVVAEAIRTIVDTAEVDLVSLGSGDGMKDNILLRSISACLRAGELCYYYPIDISDALLVEAVRTAMGTGLRRESFRLKCISGDFLALNRFLPIIEDRPNPSVYSILGNTIGNADEIDIFANLADTLLPGDLVLIEFNTGTPASSSALVLDPIATRSDFVPLASLGLEFEPERLRIRVSEGVSVVEGAQTIT